MSTRPDLTHALDGSARRGDRDSVFGHLLDVQFWLMGRDVEHPDGNVLRRLGFRREEAAEGGRSSRYCTTDADAGVVVWPCGMLLALADHGCLMVRGHEPRTVAPSVAAGLQDPAQVLELALQGAPTEPSLLARAGRWFASYERRVEGLTGIAHRVPRPGTAPSLAPPQPWSLAAAWQELASTRRSATESSEPPARCVASTGSR